MFLNLNDPESILAWWRVFPDRHSSFLNYKVKASPEFAPAIDVALRRIASEPELRELLAQAVHRSRQQEAYQSARADDLSSVQLRHQELAAA